VRPTRLTPTVQATIVGALTQGLSFTEACELARVSRSTAYEWLARGRGLDPRGRQPTFECISFADALEEAGFADVLRATREQQPAMEESGVSVADATGFADVADSAMPDTHEKRAPARPREAEHPERAWISKKSRGRLSPAAGIEDRVF
jgi:hypothetical protein